MATSGIIEIKINDGTDILGTNVWGKFEWARNEYSNINNTSTIGWTVSIKWQWGYYPSGSNLYKKIRVVVDGASTDYVTQFTGAGAGNYTQLLTGTSTINHNADGTKSSSIVVYFSEKNYSTRALAEADALQYYYDKAASGTITLDTISRNASITSAPDFNDEENPTITYSNPAGESVTKIQACISFDGVSIPVAYRDISKTGTSYTFNLTDAERTALRNGITKGNNTTVRFYVTSTAGGVTKYPYLTKTLSLVNYEPTLSPTVTATDARTKELTGDSSGKTLIRYISDVSFNTGSVARKGASIEYHTIRNGTKILDDYTSKTGTMTDVDSNTFYFSATDSRGITTNDFVVFSEDNNKFIPYIKPTNRIDSTSLSGSGVLTVKISGQYFSGSFGAKSNTMDIDYSIRDIDGNYITNPSGSGWSILTNVSPSVSGNQYTYEFTVSGLDHEKQYTIEVYVVDEITNASSSSKVIASIPVFDWSRTDFAHHTDIYMDAGKKIMSKGTNGTERQILWQGSNNGSIQLGYGNYEGASGDTRIYGNALYLYSNGTIAINGNALADFVVTEGTSGTWYYRKWNSGRCELYGYQNVSSLACNTAMGNMYRTAVITPPNFPFTVSSPKMVASYESEGYGAFFWATTLTTTAKPSNYYLVRPTSSAAITGKVHFHVQGSWK